MPEKYVAEKALSLSDAVLIDVRSEQEYAHAHIPGAVNIPLLNNEHRKIVGTTYKQEGRVSAVRKGFELAGPLFSEFYDKILQVSEKKYPIFYCWRGGLRSQISSSIFEWSGSKAGIITGGYKTYRHAVLRGFGNPLNLVILSGFTGVGKTEILQLLQQKGEQVIDFEGLAHHKGSVLGALGMPPQYSNEMFENMLYETWRKLDKNRVVFVEAESRKIGANVLPAAVWDLMSRAPSVRISLNRITRLQRILREYGSFDIKDLEECTFKIKKRLGGLNLKLAMEALQEGRISDWAEIMMDYYDRTYNHSMQEKAAPVLELEWDWEETEIKVQLLLAEIAKNNAVFLT